MPQQGAEAEADEEEGRAVEAVEQAAHAHHALDAVPDAYTRYLEKTFMEAFRLQGTPLRIRYKTTHNPFAKPD